MMVYAHSVKNFVCKGKRIGDYLYDEDSDTIYFSLPYPFPCKLAVRELTSVFVTEAMFRLPYFLIYHNIDQLCQQLSQIELIREGKVLLHAAAWQEYDGNGCIAVGLPNSGKTTTAMTKIKQGAKFCADENVIVDSKTMVVSPVRRYTSLSPILAEIIQYPLTRSQRIKFAMAKARAKLLPVFEPNIWVDLPYPRHSFQLDNIIYLTKGKNQSLLLLTDNEFPFLTNPLIQAYAYASGFDLQGIYDKYKEIINVICRNTK
jgi:hypothetical protein